MKILLADDEPIARTMLEHWLSGWDYEVVSAKDGRAALEALEADPEIRLAILDWVMPHKDGVDVCREVRQRGAEPYVYTILLTAKDDKHDVSRGLEAGADDYLVKPCNPVDLRARLRAARRVLELEDRLARIDPSAPPASPLLDPVTQILGHQATLELVRREFARSERLREPVSLVVTRIDPLDQLPQQGRSRETLPRELLAEAAQRFARVVRPYDVLGRVGDARFLLALPGCDESNAVLVAARLQYSLSSTPIVFGREPLRVTASFGVLSTTQRPGARMEHALHCVDRTLQRATEEGRNRVRLASRAEWEAARSDAASPAA